MPFRQTGFLCNDSSTLARGRLHFKGWLSNDGRFIPSCEGQTRQLRGVEDFVTIHPLLRGADILANVSDIRVNDSSPLARGRHSVFMRLSAVSNTSLCNLYKCYSCLIRIFNMSKNPLHFHFSIPITRDIPAPYDLDRPTPFLIRFRNAFASLTRSRNSYPNTLTG